MKITSKISLRLKLFAVGCVLLATIASLVVFLGPKGPGYEGKSINQWLAWFDSPSGLSPEQWQVRLQKRSEATYALRQMGPEVFPCLRRMLQPAPGATRVLHELIREIRGEHDKVGSVSLPSREEARMLRAVEACAALGREAQEMTPDLLRVLKSNSYSNVRSRAAYALGQVRGDPEKAVPALIQSLSNHVDSNVLISLGKYGPDAAPALPCIQAMLDGIETGTNKFSDGDRNVLCEAARALHQIAPEEAEKRLPLLRQVLQQEQDPFWQSRLAKVVDGIALSRKGGQ